MRSWLGSPGGPGRTAGAPAPGGADGTTETDAEGWGDEFGVIHGDRPPQWTGNRRGTGGPPVTARPTVENAHPATVLAVLGLVLNAATALAAPGHSVLRAPLVLAFAGLGPGTALVGHLRRLDAVTAAALAGLTSLTVTVAGALPASHRIPSSVLAFVAAGCALSCLVALAWPVAGRALARVRTTRLMVMRSRRPLLLRSDVPPVGERRPPRYAVPAQRTSGPDALIEVPATWRTRLVDSALLAGVLFGAFAGARTTAAGLPGPALVVSLVGSMLCYALVWTLRPDRGIAFATLLAFQGLAWVGLVPHGLTAVLGLGAAYLVMRFLWFSPGPSAPRWWRILHSGLPPAPPTSRPARYAAAGGLVVVLAVLGFVLVLPLGAGIAVG